jgi:peroxiredoxin
MAGRRRGGAEGEHGGLGGHARQGRSTTPPPFRLPEPATGATVSLDELTGPALVVTFICNHCPYVQHVAAGLAALSRDLTDQGVAMVGISSNDVVAYPQDGPDQMVAEARRHGWTFPYLFDESQDVARAFSAACTPDTFVFDGERRLVYRGQLDGSRPPGGGRRRARRAAGGPRPAAVDRVRHQVALSRAHADGKR